MYVPKFIDLPIVKKQCFPSCAGFDIRIPPTVDLNAFEEKIKTWCQDAGEGVTYKFLQVSLKEMDTLDRFFSHFYRVDTFYYFLFAFLCNNLNLKRSSLPPPKGANIIRVDSYGQGRQNFFDRVTCLVSESLGTDGIYLELFNRKKYYIHILWNLSV